MAEATRTAVYTIKIEDGPVLRSAEQITKKLSDVRAERARLNKAIRESIEEERALSQATGLTGRALAEQTAGLERVRASREALNKKLTEANVIEKGLSGQLRELTNDLSGLTDAGLRFRDKMAAANLVALESSGALQQLGDRSEKLGAQLSSVNSSLDRNEQQLAQLTIAYSKGQTQEAEYRQEKERLTKEIEAGRGAQALLKEDLAAVTKRSGELEAKLEKLNAEFASGKIDQAQYRQGLKDIDDSTKQLNSKFDSFVQNQGRELKSTLSSVALQYVGVGAAIYGVQQVLGDAITTVLEFEKALDSVASLGGEYKANIDALGDAAIDLGVKFGIGATDSVRAIEALAKAGVSAADILGGGLEGALTLAASGELEVAEAAEIASGAMTQFALGGESVSHIADLLAAGANKAQGGVGDLGAALKQSGLVAAQYGISLEETIGTLSAFASNALTGSDSGTSFKTMLQSLVPRSAEAAAEMERLGLKFFDAQGKFIGLEGVAGQLREGLQDLTQEQQASALKTIFGSDAVRAATVLYQQGAEGVAEWTTAVNESGFASEVAAEKLDNLSGDIDKAGAAWDAFVLDIEKGDGIISKVLRNVIGGFTSLLNIISGNQPGQKSIEAFTKSIQAEFTKLGGAGQLVAEETDAFVQELRIGTDEAKKFGNSLDDIQKLRIRMERFEAQSSDLESKALAAKVSGAQQLTEQEKVRLAASRVAIATLEQEIEKREAANETTQTSISIQDAEAASVRTVSAAREDLNAKLEQAKASRDGLAASDTAGIAAANKEIAAIEAQINALDGKNKKTKESADVVKGSIADFEQQIKKLRDSQATATDSAQFAAYQAQIDGLQESIDKINGTTVDLPDLKDIQFDQSANAPEQPAPISPDDLTSLGLNPNSAELLQLEYDQLLAITEEYNLKSLQSSSDINDQLFALDKEWNDGKIRSLEEYQAQRKAILDRAAQEEREREIQGAEEVLAATTQLANSLIAVQASRTANQVAEIDKRIEAERSAGRDTAQLEKEKKDVQTKAAREAFEIQRQLALAQLAIDLAKSISSLTSASAGNPTNAVTYGAAGAAQYAAGIIQILASIAQATALLNQKAPGFAGGGDIDKPSGTVTKAWGAPIKRASGDNVLVRTKYGAVALKTGEKVLNEDQQEALERLAGRGIWGAIGLPGYARNQLETARAFRQAWHGQGLAMGGTVGIVTPRPSPEAVVQNNVASQLAEFAATPIYVAWTDFQKQQRTAEVRETRNTLS